MTDELTEATAAEGQILYLSDTALDDPELDRFDRWPFSKRIADTIAARPDCSSLVIGIYGAWGEGKTSVLNFIQRELKKYSHITCIPLNPWRCKGEDEFLSDFFQTLTSALGYSLKQGKEQYAALLSYGGRVAKVFASGLAEAMKDTSTEWASVPLEEVKARVENDLLEAGKRVVVFMDDIDRLEKSEVQAVFRLVKLTAGFPNVVYVLAFDEQMVAAALSERYGQNPSAGHDFLEKIVQVPLNLPPADEDTLLSMCFQHMDKALNASEIELSDEEAYHIRTEFLRSFAPRITTPRMAARYGNAVMFALPVLAGEVNPVDLFLVEGMRVFYPQTCAVVRNNPRIMLTNADEAADMDLTQEIIEGSFGDLTSRERLAARHLLDTLFPRTQKSVFGSGDFGREWEERMADEKRVASSEYFSRYFLYSVPSGDVPERVVADLLDKVSENDGTTEATNLLNDLLRKVKPEKLLTKLFLRLDKLGPESAVRLAAVIGAAGDQFPNRHSSFGDSPFSRAAALSARLLTKVLDVGERLHDAAYLVYHVMPISLASELLRWLRRSGADDSNPVLPDDLVDSLEIVVGKRVERFCKDHNVCQEYPLEAPRLLHFWAKVRGRVRTNLYLKRLFGQNPSVAVDLLKGYLGTSWGSDTGPKTSDFRRNEYDSVGKVVRPDLVFETLKALFGAALDSPDPDSFTRRPLPEQIAHQFAYVHSLAVKTLDEDEAWEEQEDEVQG